MSEGMEAKLEALDRKLDRALDQQRALAEFLTSMTPVAKDMMAVASVRLMELEKKGYFSKGRLALDVVDQVVTTYSDDDVKALGANIIRILDTVKNLTQPDILAAANDVGDAVHHAESSEPLGRMGLLRSTGEEDVQRGLTLVVDILRQLGRARAGAPAARPAVAARSVSPVQARAEPARAAAPILQPQPLVPAERTTTVWNGATFYDDGFLKDPSEWTPELGTQIALGLGITLTDAHWTVVRWARAEFTASGASPNVRRVASGSGAGTSAVYELFPGTPGKKIAMIAGIPKPVGCI